MENGAQVVTAMEKGAQDEGAAGFDRHESADQFRELMAHLQQVFWIKNAADDAVLYVSPAYAALSGRSCQSLYDDFRTFLDAVHPEDRERVGQAIAGQRETGGYQAEYRILRADGATRWVAARSYPVRDAAGVVRRFAGIVEDVTERKALELDRARLAAIVEYSEDAIVSMSADCVIIGWSRGAERQYGYTAEEIVGRPLSLLFPPERYPEYLRSLEHVRRGEPVAAQDTVRLRKDGTLLSTSVNIFPIEVRDRGLAGASAIGRDLTEIRRLEARSIEAQKLEVVGQLAAGMAHDFNNLLSVILGCDELLLARLEVDGPVRDELETIRQAAERAAGLTRQLLVFSRRERPRPAVLDLDAVVGSVEPLLRQLVGEHIELVVVRGEGLGRIRADAGHLGQLLLNLVANARDAMPDGGVLRVSTSNAVLDADDAPSHPGAAPGAYVRLAVRDTGTGMTPDVEARLFEPLFTTKPKGTGTGLGLATCETIVKQAGGHIAVDTALGRGTTFDVYFPAVDEPLEPSPPRPGTRGPMPRGTETLLVIEGEPAVRELTCGVLESLGYTVLRAAGELAGRRVAREHAGSPIRLVVSDVGPRPSGDPALADWVGRACPGLKVVLTSGEANDAVAPRGRPAAGLALLPKPFTPWQLAQVVRTMLDQ